MNDSQVECHLHSLPASEILLKIAAAVSSGCSSEFVAVLNAAYLKQAQTELAAAQMGTERYVKWRTSRYIRRQEGR